MNSQSLSNSVNYWDGWQLGNSCKVFFNITVGPRKHCKLIWINKKLWFGKFTEESFKVISALINELNIFVTNSLFRRNPRNVYARPSTSKHLMQTMELIESSWAFPGALPVNAFHMINNMASCQLGIDNLEVIVVVLEQISSRFLFHCWKGHTTEVVGVFVFFLSLFVIT